MNQVLVVLSSDRIDAYGDQMSLSALCGGLEQSWEFGLPSLVNHDRHRLIGWGRTLGIHLEPGLARLTGIDFLPETEDESKRVEQNYFRLLAERLEANVEPYRQELEKRLGRALQGQEQLFDASCAAFLEDGLAKRTFPDVFSRQDKDGLIPIAGLNFIEPGVFEQDGFLFFASPFLRRSFSRQNTLNTPVLIRLHRHAENPALEVKVRLDPDLVGLATTYRQTMERAYWWGPKFNDDLLAIKAGVTHHEADDRLRFFSGVSGTEFWWHNQNGLKTLECEELLNRPSYGISRNHFGCRYVHSIIDSIAKCPTHFDGAVRIYDEERMIERLTKDIKAAGRHTQYEKLWRIDGPLPVPDWKEVITHHFRDNYLVGEYLGGKDDNEAMRPAILDPRTDPLFSYVPCNMVPGNGVRVSVAYHRKPEAEPPPVSVLPHDTFGTIDDQQWYVEADTLEIVKLLRRQGIRVEVPTKLSRIKFADTAPNLGMILHAGSDAVNLAEQTLQAVKSLCEALVQRDEDRIIAFGLGVVLDDRMVYYSLVGHVFDLTQFLSAITPNLPRTSAEVQSWIEDAYRHVNDLFSPASDTPPLSHMLQNTGILQFGRKWIDSTLYELGTNEAGQLGFTLSIPNDQADLQVLLSAGIVSAVKALHIIKASCSRCQRDYTGCTCSKYLDQSVSQHIEEWEFCGLFWTNRPA